MRIANWIGRTDRFLREHPLTRGHRSIAWPRVIRWQIRSRLRSEIVVPWIGGTRLAVKRGMTGLTGNVYAGLDEFEDMLFVLHMLRTGDRFVDVGANAGSYTVLAAGVAGAATIAVEPDPENFAALERNVVLNRLGDRVTLCREALGASDGVARLTIGRGPVNRIIEDGGQEVTMTTLDAVAEAPTLIKLDAEGYEPEILKGGAASFARTDLAAVLIESREAAEMLCAQFGFRPVSYDPARRAMTVPADTRRNTILIRDARFVQRRLDSAPPVTVLGRQF